jgi:four helix bundle protein
MREKRRFARFLYMSLGSASELEYFSILIADLGFLKRAEAAQIASDACEIKRMLSGLVASLPIHRKSGS